MSFLDVVQLSKRFEANPVLDRVDLSVAAGSRVAIVGPSGSGKTTLLRIVGGFERADAGTIELDGEILAGPAGVVPAFRRNIGFVPQDGALFPHLSIGENIGFGIAGGARGNESRIHELMSLVELDPKMTNRHPHELSGGQQQRVAVARALARKPKLILLDEPFSALDAGLRASIRKSIADVLRAAGTTTILVTHDQSEAMSFADQLCVMFDGRIVQAGAPQDVYFRPDNPRVAAFLGNAIVLRAEISSGGARCGLGVVPVDRKHASGPATIMLRPEQIRVTAVNIDKRFDRDGQACARAEVRDVEFCGPVSTVELRLCDASGFSGETFQIPIHPAATPKIGDIVEVAVAGAAHVFQGFDT